jgi:hypothetical protein
VALSRLGVGLDAIKNDSKLMEMPMKVHTMTRVFAAFAFALALAGVGGSAHASGFAVKIDCHGSNNLPDWAHTTNTITVKALIRGFYNTIGTFVPTQAQCAQEDQIRFGFAAFSGFDVESIQFSTNGSNVFWLDEFVLGDIDTRTEWRWGIDNNVGFCFSTQPADGQNSFCSGAAARKVWDFTK